MKIDFLSDLHIDFWIKENDYTSAKFDKQIKQFIDIILPEKDSLGEVLIIPGDLSHYNIQTKCVLLELKKYYSDIIITFGNHDLYLVSNSQVAKYRADSLNRIKELKEMCHEIDVHFLDGQVIIINEVKFGGTGSWYNLPEKEHIELWKDVMNDSRRIYAGYKPQAYGMYQMYSQPSTNWNTQKFWESEKEKLQKIAEEGCDVFITHIGLNEPTLEEGMNKKYINDPNNIFYNTNNIEMLKKSGCKLHIHGHTHEQLDYVKDNIRIVCCPLGYPSENSYAVIKQISLS